jgi:hypothetical protein
MIDWASIHDFITTGIASALAFGALMGGIFALIKRMM